MIERFKVINGYPTMSAVLRTHSIANPISICRFRRIVNIFIVSSHREQLFSFHLPFLYTPHDKPTLRMFGKTAKYFPYVALKA